MFWNLENTLEKNKTSAYKNKNVFDHNILFTKSDLSQLCYRIYYLFCEILHLLNNKQADRTL